MLRALAVALAVAIPLAAAGQTLPVAPGYAAGTTGGGNGPLCTVRTQADFTACVAGDSPAQVRPAPGANVLIYTHAARIMVGSNKTIDGHGGAFRLAADGYGLALIGVHNVIIRNLYVRGSGYSPPGAVCGVPYQKMSDTTLLGCAVPLEILSSDHVWIDHIACKLFVDKCITIWANNGPPPIKASDAITVSNSRFTDVFYPVLAGVDAAVPLANLPPVGHITFYDNIFSHTMRRSPRCSIDYQCDVAQNVIWAWGGPGCKGATWGFGISSESSQIIARNNWIEAAAGSCTEALNIQAEDTQKTGRQGPMGQVALENNILVGGATATGGTAPTFTVPYVLPLLPVWHVEDALHLSAGVQP